MLPTKSYSLLFVIALLSAPVQAQGLLGGATDVTRAVGNAAGQAINAVGNTVTSTTNLIAGQATPEETRQVIDDMAQASLNRLFQDQPGSQALFEQSVGYAVFDARQASFYVSAGFGRGVSINRLTEQRTYMKLGTAGAGLSFGFGDFERQLVILFQDEAQFQRFVREGFDASAGAKAMTGETTTEMAMRFTDGRAVFMLTGGGWKISASLTGTRYWPDEALNQSQSSISSPP